MIPDEWRAMVLNRHNEYRRKLAKGLQAGSTGAALPYATKMSQLYWDCNVEELAREQADACPTTTPTVANYGNSFELIAAKGTCNTTAVTEARIKAWWTDGAKKQASNAKVADNDLFSQVNIVQLLWNALKLAFESESTTDGLRRNHHRRVLLQVLHRFVGTGLSLQ
ncbi:SCP-like protein [Ancylostoma duodenale]|uniref:SCP-like protein n=1 Tax=Ancylostoma duodenale TaxID=51022 RepID=A0A0C2G1X8_9BILA|nr:SCP-like protein [Ancylostoma duodenale]